MATARIELINTIGNINFDPCDGFVVSCCVVVVVVVVAIKIVEEFIAKSEYLPHPPTKNPFELDDSY
jgi:hypothetical protein